MTSTSNNQHETHNKNEDKPIPGPEPAGPEYIWEPDHDRPMTYSLWMMRGLADLVRVPAHWIRQNIVEPNRGPKYYWYHKKFGKPLPVDECYEDDFACLYEADLDFKRTKMIDKATLELLRYRRDSCHFWYIGTKGMAQPADECKDLVDTYTREEINYFIKYGDMHWNASVLTAYNKQKHRMIMERRKELKKQQGELPEHQS